jgi:hypothetical protein
MSDEKKGSEGGSLKEGSNFLITIILMLMVLMPAAAERAPIIDDEIATKGLAVADGAVARSVARRPAPQPPYKLRSILLEPFHRQRQYQQTKY